MAAPLDITRLTPQPTGFGRCRSCAYRDVGSAAICYSCAVAYLAPLPSPRCSVCEHPLGDDPDCKNPVCGWPTRAFEKVWAISTYTGQLKRTIKLYKYPPENRNWGIIFGRRSARRTTPCPWPGSSAGGAGTSGRARSRWPTKVSEMFLGAWEALGRLLGPADPPPSTRAAERSQRAAAVEVEPASVLILRGYVLSKARGPVEVVPRILYGVAG